MPLQFTRSAFARVFTQRCFWLFAALLLLIVTVPFAAQSAGGRIAVNSINVLVLLAAIAAVGRSLLSFMIGLMLALPTVAFQLLGISTGEPRYLTLSWIFGGAFYFAAIVYLLRYVFSRDAISVDKLYGAAALYLLLAVLWAYLYGIAQYYFPGSFATGGGAVGAVAGPDLIYFSFTVLTTTGFGDITAVLPLARTLVTLEQVTGTLFVAILIARLAGVYPEQREK